MTNANLNKLKAAVNDSMALLSDNYVAKPGENPIMLLRSALLKLTFVCGVLVMEEERKMKGLPTIDPKLQNEGNFLNKETFDKLTPEILAKCAGDKDKILEAIDKLKGQSS